MTAGDTAVDMTYQAGMDKWWMAYNIVGINVYEPLFGMGSTKSWELGDDADVNGVPLVGDAIRYTIWLSNTGTAEGRVDVFDAIPPQAASWTLVDDAGGTDASTATCARVAPRADARPISVWPCCG